MHDLDGTFDEVERGFGPYSGQSPSQPVFNEMDELKLAANLLEVGSEEEMDHFLGDLFTRAAGAIGSFVRGPVGEAIGGVLKNVARTALPTAGAALGNLVAPGVGGAIGSKLASVAGQALGLEGVMSSQDQEFEVARRIVRLAGEAARNAAQIPPRVPPVLAARSALVAAADRVAPGLAGVIAQAAAAGTPDNEHATVAAASGVTDGVTDGAVADRMAAEAPAQSGRWVRRGNRILLLGV